MNYEIKIDVTKIDKKSLLVGQKGTYLTLVVQELKNGVSQYGDTHFVKQSLSKEVYQAMSEDERKNIPILGNMKPSKFQRVETVEAEDVTPAKVVDPFAAAKHDSLPF